MTFPPFEMMAAAIRAQRNIWAGYRKNRADWFPDDLKDKHGPEHQSKHVYFAGCTASYVENDITPKHYSEVISEKIKSGQFKFPENEMQPMTVTWHDSCHIGRVSGVYDEPRELIRAIPNVNLVEMEHHREDSHCCGSVLTLIKEPRVAADIGKGEEQ